MWPINIWNINNVFGTGTITSFAVNDDWGTPDRFTDPDGIGTGIDPVAYGANTFSTIQAAVGATSSGDVVNVAARIESESAGNEILISKITADLLDKKEFNLGRKGSFTPKGKSKKMSLYYCNWEMYPWIADDIKTNTFLPVVPRQKFETLIYALISIFTLYFIYQNYNNF